MIYIYLILLVYVIISNFSVNCNLLKIRHNIRSIYRLRNVALVNIEKYKIILD